MMFDDFEKEYERESKTMFKWAGVGVVIILVGNLIFWGGLIWFVFYLLKNFGVI